MSLIVYPVASDSRAFQPAAFSLAMQTNQRAFASPFGGSEQVTDMLNDRWSCTLDLPLTEHNRAAKREAFIEAMRGQTNHTDLHHFGRPTPLGTAQSSAGLVVAAAQGAATLQIATTAGATLLAGDMLGVDDLLLRCAADCTANSNGLLTVPLTNRLRRAVAGLARASTATFVDGAGVLQTAGVNVPRYQGGALLVEAAATNLIRFSEQFDNAAWSKESGGTGVAPVVTPNAAIAPDGTLSADRVVFNKGSGTSVGDQSIVQQYLTTVIGQPTCAFVWLISATAVNYQVRLDFNGASSQGADFPSLVTCTPSWQRFEIRLDSAVDTGRTLYIRLRGEQGTSDFADVFAWGAQQEIAAAATSYIPTTAATVTRAADIVRPVTLDRPTAPFRLASTPSVRYVAGYAEGVTLDFVEMVS